MPASPRPPRRRPPKLLLRNYVSPDQGALLVITNAIRAVLEFSPLRAAPNEEQQDLFAYVAREIDRRFWTDLYIARPEIREILFTLETGRIALVTGERGTGKSTAIAAVVQEVTHHESWPHVPSDGQVPAPHLIPYVFNALEFTEELYDDASVTATIHRNVYEFFDGQIEDRAAWTSYIHANHWAYELFRHTLDNDGLTPRSANDWRYLATQGDYRAIIAVGDAKFVDAPHVERLSTLLDFFAEHRTEELLLVIDNIDHLDSNSVIERCGIVLSNIIASSTGQRLRGAIAVRPENADAIQHVLDTSAGPIRISMMERSLTVDDDESPIDLTLSFLRKRIMVLREPAMREAIIGAVPPDEAKRLSEASGYAADGVDAFLGAVLEVVDLLVFDVFSSADEELTPTHDDWEFVRAVHLWHNGSLRDCASSLAVFASDILQDKAHTYSLRELLQMFAEPVNQDANRRKVRRISRSLLYRHLLFWAAGENARRPLRNVLVFDGTEEETTPPIHFLRLRLLQYLQHRERGRASVRTVREDFRKLGVARRRIDQALAELAVKRSHDDGGLIRIDGLADAQPDSVLRADAKVQLLDAGKFLVSTLYITTEYLFWSAVTIDKPDPALRLPARIPAEAIQSDAFRISIGARFLEKHLVGKFCDEHPYLRGPTTEWPQAKARQRLNVYQQLFGFSERNWFLDRAADSVEAFMRGHSGPRFDEARASVERVRALARLLDQMIRRTAAGG